MKLLLASKSETRRAMLAAAGVPFDVIDFAFDEDVAKAGLTGLGAAALADALAETKASFVPAGAGILVLGSDQTLERDDGAMLDKPLSYDEAFAQLRSLSGKTHRLHSAVVIAEEGQPVWRHTESAVLTMRRFSDVFLRNYLDREYEMIRWSVGGYRIEGRGVQLFEHIEGSHFAILGLPLLPLLSYLRERGIILT